MMRIPNSLCALTFLLLLLLTLPLSFANSAEGQNSGCSSEEVRLVDGRDEYEGRVEVCFHEIWFELCGDNWDDTDATVVCRQLGFTHEGIAVYYETKRGLATWTADFLCTGNELQLTSCSYQDDHDCYSGFAGVSCYQEPSYGTATSSFIAPTMGPQSHQSAALGIAVGTVCAILSIGVMSLVVTLAVIIVRKKQLKTQQVTEQDHSHSDAVNNPVYNTRQSESMAGETVEQQPSDYSTVLNNPLYSATAPTYTEVTDTDKHPALHKHMQHTEPQPYEVPVSIQNCNYAAFTKTTETNKSKDNNASSKKNQPPSQQLPSSEVTTQLQVPGRDSHNVSHSNGDTTGDYSTLSTDGQYATLEPHIPGTSKIPHKSNKDENDYSHLQHHT